MAHPGQRPKLLTGNLLLVFVTRVTVSEHRLKHPLFGMVKSPCNLARLFVGLSPLKAESGFEC